ncbi:unnamed protein product [Fusarium venenatum]|uniref:Uncharacterized protein n=1 Tax=Fusarium venenatum TaxID=56646 RepID=A0A2L2TFD8_9HYPO|nr:uncharacterized protein FVRRES_11738 [Fusarium venenatum]CEI39047.1 unnamed protein product [Fusarium venenatum]
MTSPKLQARRLDLQRQLKKILAILNKEYLTVPNSEARLKIAVYLHKYIATLDQMKAIAALIWTMDTLLGDVHPRHCGPNSIYSLGLQYSNLVRSSPLCLKTQLDSAVDIPDPWDNRLSPNRCPLELLVHPGELREEEYTSGVDMILDADSVGELTRRLDLSIGETGISVHKSNPGLRCSSVLSRRLHEVGLQKLVDYHKSTPKTSRMPDLQYWYSDGRAFSRVSSSYMSFNGSSILLFWEGSPFTVYERRFAPSSSVNGKILFGVELEFYTAIKPDISSQPSLLIDPSPEDDRQIGNGSTNKRAGRIAEMITSKGRLALARSQVPPDTPGWRISLAKHGIVPIPGIDPVYQVWTVLPDYSVTNWEDWAGYAGVDGMEVVSPVLADIPTDWENVVDMLSILRNNFRQFVPNSCGFHIPDIGKCCISLSKCDFDSAVGTEYNGTVKFRFLEGTLDPELIADRVAAMSELEEHKGQKDRRGEHQGLLSRIEDTQINTLRNDLCQREISLPCLAAKKGVVQEPGTAQNPSNLEERLERKTKMHAHLPDARP